MHFTITGEVITEQARSMMLSEDPGKAYRLIADCLIGEGVHAVACKVLAGEVNLTGDSTVGIQVESSEPDEVREYLENLRYIYAGRVRLRGRWYQPSGVVMSFGPEDAKFAETDVIPLGSAVSAWSRKRAEFYAGIGGIVEKIRHIDGEDQDGRFVVFNPCSEPPQWLTPVSDAQAAVTASLAAGRELEILGADTLPAVAEAERWIRDNELEDEAAEALRELAYAAEDAQRAALLAEIGTRVREQAGSDIFAMTLEDGRIIQVPRAPFVHWALSRIEECRQETLPPWDCVSRSGIKMQNDDPYHTDWVLGAGLTIEEGYSDNVSSPAWEKASIMQFAEVDRA